MNALRAFPVLHARDVEAVAEPQPGPRHELFVYVSDVDAVVTHLYEMGAPVLREPADMFCGERVAYVSDPRAASCRWPTRP
jgi:uncharacterized glyoxalase superfamily protein PhnB